MANLIATLNVMSVSGNDATIQGSIVYGGNAASESFITLPVSAFDDTPANMLQAIKDAVESYALNTLQIELQPGEQVYILGGPV